MAASSSSSRPKYEVFLSFQGEDTRNNFTSHLYASLNRKQIKTFIDHELDRGEVITPTLSKLIEETPISVVIFSKNYASSQWCLDELVKIIECKKSFDQIVLPIFYGVDPSDVAEQKESYRDAFARHEKCFENSKDNNTVQKWRAALTEAASLSGWDSLVVRPESRLIEEIVEAILKKLNRISSSVNLKGLVGIHSHIEKIESLLSFESMNVRILGIWGMGGIGKTTIAGVIFDHFSSQFEGCCFVGNFREEAEKNGLYKLQRELFSKVFGEENLDIGAYSIRSSFGERLRRSKVLMVLDDVDNFRQIEILVRGHEFLGPGSRIIITSRDKDVFKTMVDEIYEVLGLNYDEALELFSLNAFKQNEPREDYIKLSEKVLSYANGNPLALKILGSFLHRRSMREWESALHKLQRTPNTEIHNFLRISFDGLDDEEKDIFLDIACFFKGEDRDFVRRILLGCGFSFDIVISVLIDKSLVTISNNKLEMHNLLQRMGQEIVRQESVKEPGKRSRLWTSEDGFGVLTRNMGTETIEGIFFDMSKISEASLDPKAFARMNRLRLLKLNWPSSNYFTPDSASIRKGLKSLSDKLSYFHWEACPLQSFPSNFQAASLVELSLPYSQVELLWESNQNLEHLYSINLKHSRSFIRLPDLSQALNLECINLEGCISLDEVTLSIARLNKLAVLNLANCKMLKSIPNCNNLKSLCSLNLCGCFNLKNLPEISSSVKELIMDKTAIEELPSSTENLSELSLWSMRNCKNLRRLPSNICMLKSLKCLLVSGCIKLEMIPIGIENLHQLQRLDISGCVQLMSLPTLPPYLSWLNATSCLSLETISSPLTAFTEKMLPKCPNNQRFCFINCPRLNQNALKFIEDDSEMRIRHTAFAAVRDYHQGYHSIPSTCFCIPGNNIPKWFGYWKTGSEITISLPSDWLDSKFLGFAVCAVVEGSNYNDIYVGCECNFMTNDGDNHTVECHLRGFSNMSEVGLSREESNHVFLGYDFSLYLRARRKNLEKVYYYREATFTFYSKKEAGHSYTLRRISNCGVHLLYARDADAEIQCS